MAASGAQIDDTHAAQIVRTLSVFIFEPVEVGCVKMLLVVKTKSLLQNGGSYLDVPHGGACDFPFACDQIVFSQ